MKVDVYAEMYLWNRGVDRLIRVLQRLEVFSIGSRRIRCGSKRSVPASTPILPKRQRNENASMKIASAGSEQLGK